MIPIAKRGWWDGPWPWLAYLLFYPLPWIWTAPSVEALYGSALGMALFVPAYLLAFQADGRRMIVISAFIVALGFALSPLGAGWTTLSIYAGLLLGRLRPMRHAVMAVILVASLTSLWGAMLEQSFFAIGLSVLLIVMTGMGSASREAFYDRTVALLSTQEEVRRLAGTAERERMVRDLHDVVGRTLTLIAIKSDLAGKLVSRDPAAAQKETGAIGQIARSGLTEIRAALSGQLGGSLVHELQASVDALGAAGIDVQVTGDAAPLPRDASAILAMALREAVTNTIRHSQARSCAIAISQDDSHARLAVTDDGISDGNPDSDGSGLRGMRQRLAAAGGSLALAPNRPGLRLEAWVPA
ncbi:sensor histidine kinase [Novosphingopyxis sp.]|uniref:sensor histidine kinase n=1 Tax=Novosphingopyxis sp. TaxID=2709690 RepID=UPI003B5C20BD